MTVSKREQLTATILGLLAIVMWASLVAVARGVRDQMGVLPAAAAANSSPGPSARQPPVAPARPRPGRWTEWVASNSTGTSADAGTGALIGTVRYMSPEQLRGGKVAVGWDLWALAVVAYEALAGAYPFAGTTAAEFSSAILAGQFVPVSAHVPGAPASWQGFFSHALSLDSNARPASAQGLLAEFEKAV